MRTIVVAALAAAGSCAAGQALAWGATGHHMITALAMDRLPPELPTFLKTRDADFDAAEIAREPDRSKGGGETHDAELWPGHSVEIDDAGKVLGGPALADLPETREAYDTALRAVGHTQYDAGYLPYNIVIGWQQLTKDFAYWRVLVAAEERETDPAKAARFARDRDIREGLILRDLAYWSHFVADGSQPMHVSVHVSGWGDYPNPHDYTTARIHAPFEGAYVRAYITPAMVAAHVADQRPGNEPIWERTKTYLGETLAQVVPLYEIEKAHGYVAPSAQAEDFVAARMAAAVAEIGDMVAMAWAASATTPVGYPPVLLRDVEAGTDPTGALFGLD